jgi:uncharacterized protein YjeT (DUF2065 family)
MSGPLPLPDWAASRLARAVAALSDKQLRIVGRGPVRRLVLATIMRVLPTRIDRAAAANLEAVIELRIRAANGGGGGRPDHYELVVDHGRCRVRHRPSERAAVTLTLGGSDLVRLATGAASWPQLLGDGRLQLTGDPFLALRFPALFRLPARAP